MKKLYGLMVCEDENSFFRYLSFSHSIQKLEKSIFVKNHSWFVGDNGAHTDILVFPQYRIEEVNFII